MRITRKSAVSGEVNTIDLPVTCEQLSAWMGGEPIQRALRHLPPWDREFILTGTTRAEWDAMFPAETEAEEDRP